jgi:mannose/fructose/N-acetylgalactosamine-specific phosphotransferase system component IID
LDTNQVCTFAIRAFAVVGVTAAFFPALTKSRSVLGMTFLGALVACAILWSH